MPASTLNFVLGMIVGGALVAGGMLLGGMAQVAGGDAAFGKLTAREITLTDARGRSEVMKFRAAETGGSISVFDVNGKEILTLGATRLVPPTSNDPPLAEEETIMYAGTIDVRTSDNILAARTSANTFGGFVAINNLQGRNAATMGVQQSANGVIAVNDLGGTVVAIIAGTPQGGIFRSQDRRANVLGQIPAGK